MSQLRRIVLLRHGNTVGDSHERFHGSGNVALSEEGRQQVLAAGRGMGTEVFERVASSPLRRAWESASLLAGGTPVLLVPEFREIHFGRWEGLTSDEILAQDPALHAAWQSGSADFDYPGGERRADFKARVVRGIAALERSGALNVLVVAHKGVIRTIFEHLTGSPLATGVPDLGASVSVTRSGDSWHPGRNSSDPPALREAAA